MIIVILMLFAAFFLFVYLDMKMLKIAKYFFSLWIIGLFALAITLFIRGSGVDFLILGAIPLLFRTLLQRISCRINIRKYISEPIIEMLPNIEYHLFVSSFFAVLVWFILNITGEWVISAYLGLFILGFSFFKIYKALDKSLVVLTFLIGLYQMMPLQEAIIDKNYIMSIIVAYLLVLIPFSIINKDHLKLWVQIVGFSVFIILKRSLSINAFFWTYEVYNSISSVLIALFLVLLFVVVIIKLNKTNITRLGLFLLFSVYLCLLLSIKVMASSNALFANIRMVEVLLEAIDRSMIVLMFLYYIRIIFSWFYYIDASNEANRNRTLNLIKGYFKISFGSYSNKILAVVCDRENTVSGVSLVIMTGLSILIIFLTALTSKIIIDFSDFNIFESEGLNYFILLFAILKLSNVLTKIYGWVVRKYKPTRHEEIDCMGDFFLSVVIFIMITYKTIFEFGVNFNKLVYYSSIFFLLIITLLTMWLIIIRIGDDSSSANISDYLYSYTYILIFACELNYYTSNFSKVIPIGINVLLLVLSFFIGVLFGKDDAKIIRSTSKYHIVDIIIISFAIRFKFASFVVFQLGYWIFKFENSKKLTSKH